MKKDIFPEQTADIFTGMAEQHQLLSSTPQKQAVEQLKIIETAPASSGKTNLLKHLKKMPLTRGAAILAKCCDCMGYYTDGRADCRTEGCPLYPFSPYRDKETKEVNQ